MSEESKVNLADVPLARAGWHRIFVYGTLKRDQVNYPFWMPKTGESVFQGEGQTVSKYPLFVNEGKYGSSPCLMDAKDEYPDRSHRVLGEVYDVSTGHLEALHTLEGISLGVYKVGEVQVEWTRFVKQQQQQAGDGDENENEGSSTHTSTCAVYFRNSRLPANWASTRTFIPSFDVHRAVRDNSDYSYIVPQLKKQQPENIALAPPIAKPDPMVLLIVDGIGDTSYKKVLGGKTPLQCLREQRRQRNSSTPTGGGAMIDTVASQGVNGLMDSVCAGESCGSDTAHLSMFGYDPTRYYEGRGAFEAMGAGMEMENGDIAFKSNFATLVNDFENPNGNSVAVQEAELNRRKAEGLPLKNIVVARRCDRNFEAEGPVLCDYLDGLEVNLPFGDYKVNVKYATEHRCGVVIKGPWLSSRITGTDPLKDGCVLRHCVSTREQGTDDAEVERNISRTCEVINAVSDAIQLKLEQHPMNAERVKQGKNPANVVLLRGAAMKSACPPMVMRHGLRTFMVAPTCIISGLGKTLGMDIVTAPGATGDYHSNLTSKATTFLETLKTQPYDFGVLHVKSVDDAGHDKDPQLKLDLLEKVDKMLEEVLWPGLPEGTTLCITGDHSTSCHFGDHTCEPVPVTIAIKPSTPSGEDPTKLCAASGAPAWKDEVAAFDEVSCAQSHLSGLGRFNGIELLDVMKRYHRHRFVLES